VSGSGWLLARPATARLWFHLAQGDEQFACSPSSRMLVEQIDSVGRIFRSNSAMASSCGLSFIPDSPRIPTSIHGLD